MHVLVTADTVGGVWTYARELVTGLIRHGVQVTLVSFGEIPTTSQVEWMEGLRGLNYHPTAFRLEWMQEAEQDFQASSDYLLSLIEETKPDLLHINQYCYGALPVSVPKIVVAHSDVASWWAAVKGEDARDVEWLRWYREAVSAGLDNANVVVAPTQWMLDQVGLHYGKPNHGTVIYNGRNPGLFNPHTTKEEFVVSVGRLWDAGKQVSLLAQVAPVVPIYIAGAEEHADAAFRSDAKTVDDTKPRVHCEGPQSEGQLRQLYGRACMYAATSRYEPFGLAPLEAALSRCAIVANDIPTFHEIWGQTACYFRYNDAQSLASTIERLHTDRELRLTYANLAYNRARQRFTAERMVKDYMNLYKTMAPAGAAA
ncbi:MAG TPA: glycosyltransferase family 4 protein [Clostridia bacterium]|nr:glycosyltransferase family 4 protein [Clostridia bacterium]